MIAVHSNIFPFMTDPILAACPIRVVIETSRKPAVWRSFRNEQGSSPSTQTLTETLDVTPTMVSPGLGGSGDGGDNIHHGYEVTETGWGLL